MKSIFLLAVIFFSGCYMTWDNYYDCALTLIDEEITTEQEIADWIFNNIKSVSEENDYWKSPMETLRDKEGDCEDVAILYMYLVKEILGIETSFVVLYLERYQGYHAVVRTSFHNYLYSPSNPSWDNYGEHSLYLEVDYNDTMEYVTQYLTKNIY